jgi:hypothetical protein
VRQQVHKYENTRHNKIISPLIKHCITFTSASVYGIARDLQRKNTICYEKYNNCTRSNMQYIFFEVQQKAVDSLKLGIAISFCPKR